MLERRKMNFARVTTKDIHELLETLLLLKESEQGLSLKITDDLFIEIQYVSVVADVWNMLTGLHQACQVTLKYGFYDLRC